MTQADYAVAVRRAMEDGCSVEEVEEGLINPAPLNDDQKSALWLLAWSYVPKDRQRTFARELMALTRVEPCGPNVPEWAL